MPEIGPDLIMANPFDPSFDPESRRLTSAGIKDLQDLLEEASIRRRTNGRGLSRAAELHAIDALSRETSAGLGVIAGACIFVAATFGGKAIPSAILWMVIMFSALFICQQLRVRYRAGEYLSGHPFRWRAQYTASLSVLSAATGAGVLMLSSGSIAGANMSQLAVCLGLGLACATVFHKAHLKAGMAIAAPGLCFVAIASARMIDAEPVLLGTAWLAIFTILVATIVRNRKFLASIKARFPRTTFNRKRKRPNQQTSSALQQKAVS